jgi:tetratricopeptide (TPR) repeat protein
MPEGSALMLQTKAESDASPEASRAAGEARAAADAGDWNAARAAMARAIDLSPNDAAFHAHMAWYSHQASALAESERQRLADHHLQVALELDPHSAEAHYVQGLVWADGGNTTRARIALTTALKERPGHQAATSALGRLDNAVANAPASQEPGAALPGGRRGSKLRLPLVLAAAAVTAVGGLAFFLSSETRGMGDLATRLGTRLSISSASEVSQDLYIDVGSSWDVLPENERPAEMSTIAQHAAGLNLRGVFVYARSELVGETHGEKVCIGPCGPPAAAPARPAAAAR